MLSASSSCKSEYNRMNSSTPVGIEPPSNRGEILIFGIALSWFAVFCCLVDCIVFSPNVIFSIFLPTYSYLSKFKTHDNCFIEAKILWPATAEL